MKKIILLLIFTCLTASSKAQINEIGFFVGASNYIGDIGSETYINPNNIMLGAIYKWNMNPRIAIRGTFTYSQLSADDLSSDNPARYERGIHFTNSLKELALGMEFNFFEYNLDNYRTTHTPYLLFELAAFNYNVALRETGPEEYEYEAKTAFAIPFGIGYKSKLYNDLAIALELRVRYTFEDDLDYNNNSINSLTFGNPNSNDWYVFSGISIVYSFGRPPCYATPY